MHNRAARGSNQDAFLTVGDFVDWHNEDVRKQAVELCRGVHEEIEITRRCFEFVRDEIRHSWDFHTGPVTCKASEVLKHGTGYCYAKSHLLAALLRANGIPAGLCYQRLTITDEPPFCLHGLNAVYLQDHGWYRLDARGNKPGVDAQFCPPREQLAFPIKTAGEADLPEIWPEPLPVVLDVLARCHTIEQVAENLPDIE